MTYSLRGKLIDCILKSVKSLDETGVKCRAVIYVNKDCYHYNYLKIKQKTKPIDGFFRLHIDKYSTDLGGWLCYYSKFTKIKNEDDVFDILVQVLQEIINQGIKNLLK